MNIRQLEYFLEVARTLNFTKAAQKYFISQTAMTQQIKSLESQLEVRLFERSNRHVELTPAGNVFVKEAEAIINRTIEAMERTRSASTGFSGTLNIGFVKGYEQSSFSMYIQSFHRNYPNISLSFERDNPSDLYEGLRYGKYDIIFNIDFETNQYSNIHHHLVKKYRIIAVLYPNHPLVYKDTLKRTDLKNEQFIINEIHVNEHDGSKKIISNYIDDCFMPNILKQSKDFETILLMVSAEMGITILPEYTIRSIRNVMNLAFIPLEGDTEFIEIVAAWNEDNSNPALTKFLATLESL